MSEPGPKPRRPELAAASTRRRSAVPTLRETLIVPLTTYPPSVGRESSPRAVEEASRGARQLVPVLLEQVRREMRCVSLASLDEALDMVLTKA